VFIAQVAPRVRSQDQQFRDGTAASAAAVASEAREDWEKSLAEFSNEPRPLLTLGRPLNYFTTFP